MPCRATITLYTADNKGGISVKDGGIYLDAVGLRRK
jgi:hypothetical protein